ncbi:MAG: pyrroline-5-carboxylate reductase [Candidatus Omnitrophota bacterium]|nr:pyrroline-5-carboxylate reductase [Candidatus Omnitrophota bacterium]
MMNKKIGIIGCGNMGEAILGRLVNVMEKSTSIMVSEFDAKRRDYLQGKYKMIIEIDNNEIVKFSDVIILAVKPKDIDGLLKQEVCCGVSKNKLIISIAAGITIKHIEDMVGKDVPVIRAMPNLGAIIGHAVTSLSAGESVNKEDIELAKNIFSLIGDVVEVDEKLVDAVTAVSGSGPAYFFYFVESLYEVAQELKLPPGIAKALVIKTALGSIKLLDELKEDPAALRKKVTSKGGTTEAAFKVLEYKKVKNIIKDAVKEACKRSKEISKGK